MEKNEQLIISFVIDFDINNLTNFLSLLDYTFNLKEYYHLTEKYIVQEKKYLKEFNLGNVLKKLNDIIIILDKSDDKKEFLYQIGKYRNFLYSIFYKILFLKYYNNNEKRLVLELDYFKLKINTQAIYKKDIGSLSFFM